MKNDITTCVKGVLLFAFSFLAFSPAVQAQKIEVDSYEQLRMTFSVDMPTVGEATLDGQTFTTLSLDGYMPSEGVGTPALPVWSHLIETPLNSGIDVEVTDAVYDTLQLKGAPLMPLQPSRSKSDTLRHPLAYNKEVYSWDAFVGEPTKVEDVGIARDRCLARLQFSPVQYNPVRNQIVVCRQATVTVSYANAAREATLEMFERYHSPAFNSGAGVVNNLYPKAVRTAAPVRYLIVANSMFRGQLDELVEWKRRKGFLTDIVYTDNAAVGTTTTSIQNYIKSQYTNATTASPAPTYVLLVGDVGQLPAFDAQVSSPSSDHVTDLYYMTWTTGDHIPDCHYGRFSAQNVSQLTPQVQKTLMYEQYTFADPSFLDRAVMVAGVDGGNAGDYGYNYADPAMDYAIANYVNGTHGFSDVRYFKNDLTIIPSCTTNVTIASNSNSMSATVRGYYNQGAGLINYSAHGSANSWGTPNFTTTHVAAMTNTQKFGLMIGNCCLTNRFNESTCFGESLLRKGNYCGAVGYIGGSNSTYWSEDFYWAVGVRSGIGATMSLAYNASYLGVYDRVFHLHNEANSLWATTQGSIMMYGNQAVESSTTSSSMKHYYWEIYHLMGDPSVMPYMTQANAMTLTASNTITYGSTTLSVSAAPYAYVALTDTATHTLVAAAWANGSGMATLTLPATVPVGGYEIAAWAQQYRQAFRNISIIQPNGPFPSVASIVPVSPLVPGDTVALEVTVENSGTTTATGVNVTLASSSPMLTLPVNTLSVGSMAAGAQRVFTTQIYAVVNPAAADNTPVNITSTATWAGSSMTAVTTQQLTIGSPVLTIGYSDNVPSIQPGGTKTLTVKLVNSGHAALPAYSFAVASPTSHLTVSPSVLSATGTLAGGDSISAVVTLHADAQLPQGIDVPLTFSVSSRSVALAEELPVFVGNSYCETFEGNQTHLSGWSYGAIQWIIYDTGAYDGTYCAGSSYTMSHSMTSEMNISCTSTSADSISFYYKVSSESNYDKFHFLIDGTEMFNDSGEKEWTRAAYPVEAGTHTFTFTYTKDHSVSSGSDRAWVDNITLPHSAQPVAFRSDTVCVGQSYSVGTQTINTSVPGSGSTSTTQADGTLLLVDYTILGTMREDIYETACGSYTWFGTTYTASTEATHTVSTAGGCDSTSVLHLTIMGIVDEVQAVAVCDSFYWNGTMLMESGSVTDTVHGADGCDTVRGLQLTVNHSSFDTVYAHTEAMNYEWNGTVYTETGIYPQVLTTAEGCDSTVTLILTFGNDPVPGTEGIDDFEAVGLTLYPNPTAGMLSLGVAVSEVVVYDMLGHELLRRSDVSTLDLSALPQGVYMLRLTLPAATATRRVVKE